jgi:hypothetical protein
MNSTLLAYGTVKLRQFFRPALRYAEVSGSAGAAAAREASAEATDATGTNHIFHHGQINTASDGAGAFDLD